MHPEVHEPAAAVDVRPYLAVFGALIVLTLVTVAASYLDLSTTPTVTLALGIASGKAALVGLFFMHLNHERPLIYWSLGLTAVLFLALIGFVLWTEADHLFGTRFTGAFWGGAP
jgi:cytochrome c oxidase subunit 4